ncbi:MAG TPA: DMT family transporter [Dongiaceae bacterium]|nr:DMT family transporter [Dongiaceae bacterium]
MTAATSAPSVSKLPAARSFDAVLVAAFIITVCGWASAFPAIREGLQAIDPLQLGAIRFTIAAVPAAAFLMVTRPRLPSLGEACRLAAGGLLFVTFYTVLLNMGERTISSGAASFIVNISPIMVALLAIPVLKERFGLRAWLGTLVSFGGIGLIALGDNGGGEGNGIEVNQGALFILGAAACTAVSTVLLKPLYARHRALTISAWTMLFGALFLSPGLLSGIDQAMAAPTAARNAAIYLGVVPSFIAYGGWSVVLSRLPAGRAANLLYCIPPVATLIGWLWLDELPGLFGTVGGVMALGGVIIVNLRAAKRT